MTSRPNVVLLCVDQWRGDCLSIDGHPTVLTPYLDKIALQGVRCRRAYSATPVCPPARAALMTGLSQRSHGRLAYVDGIPWNYEQTIAGEFTRHGYQTHAVGKMQFYPERSQVGFQSVLLYDGKGNYVRDGGGQNFDRIDDYTPWLRERAGVAADYSDYGESFGDLLARPWNQAEYLHPTNWVATQGVEFLRRRDTRKPFFLYLSFHRPLPPYDPPVWAFEQYVNQPMQEPPVGDWTDVFDQWRQPGHSGSPVTDIDPRLSHRMRAGYFGHMSHIDQQIDRFKDVLTEYGFNDNTFWCFTSDHGSLMGDHRLYQMGFPYEGSARVPLILSGPWGSGIKHNAVIDDVVELRDIIPTLLDCAGLPIPESVEGRSFLPQAQGKESTWRTHLHGELVMFDQSLQWITTGREKYVWFSGSGHEQLFDLDSDPHELHDLARDSSGEARIAPLRRALVEELADREEGFTDGSRLITGRPVHRSLSHLTKSVQSVGCAQQK